MQFGPFKFIVWVALVGGVVTGCKKSPPAEPSAALPTEKIARIHWLGARQVGVETNSAAFLKLWQMPEGQALKTRILDQIAQAPQRLASTGSVAPVTNSETALLRPLLDDLLQDESFLEINLRADQKLMASIAIRLDTNRSVLWKTNLKALKASDVPDLSPNLPWVSKTLDFKQSGDWCFVGLGESAEVAASSMDDFIKSRSVQSSGSFWVEAEVGLGRIGPLLFPKWKLPTGWPNLRLALSGNPEGVSTKAVADFPYPLPFQLEPWQTPTNLIHGPITSFTAIRGFGPLLGRIFGTNFLFGPPPNQAFCWSERPYASLTYLALPVPEAEKRVGAITDWLLESGNRWLSNSASGRFMQVPHGVRCTAGNPLMGPFLEAAGDDQQAFILAGLGKNAGQEKPAPEWLADTSHGQTNLLLFDRELTGRQVGSWLFMGQALRIVFWKPQLPFDSTSIHWLKAATPMLGPCVTKIAQTGPNQLTLDRSSTVGLDSVELHLFADWIESPDFPRGLYTTVSPDLPRPKPFHRTNAPPAPVTNTNR